jgi:hypothetical protein
VEIADRIYERLKPEERFRAAMEAISRQDLAELDRLNEACPVEQVRIQSLAYFGRLRGFFELSMLNGIWIRDLIIGMWACITKMQCETQQVPDDANTEVSADSDSEVHDDVSDTLCDLVSRLKAYRKAWVEFCESIGVDPVKAPLSYFGEAQFTLELFEEIEIEPDPETYTSYSRSLREAWQHHCTR